MAITGGCLCGTVRFAIEAEAPLFARQCWCRVCQYIGAGSGTVNAFFKKDAVRVSGGTTDFVCRADSGSTIHRSFCAQCGTHLFAEAEERPEFIVVRVGTLDDPNLAKPGAIIWTKSAPAWAYFHPALPQTEGQPSGPPKT
ncbi:MAG: GFA family protein [Hyphomicrobiales bacterium]|nr:GFA family protein [Hyphomicrobiales bacterium]